RTEAGKIIDIMQRMALNNPSVSIRLVFDDKERFKTPGNGSLKEVIHILYGMQVSTNTVAVSGDSPDYKVSGYIVKPEITRSNRNYINLSQAIIDAYHTLQANDKYPLVFLNITMDPKLLDVNVHPSKVEVKLSKEKELLELVENTVRRALLDLNLIPEVGHQSKEKQK